MPAGPLPLEGLLVADFSRILAGPLCTMMLADAGARVIKVEEPRRGDETRRWGPPFAEGESAYYLSVNRNKESIAIDLRAGEGQEIARRLVERADVVVHNFLPAQQEKLRLRAEDVKAMHPRVIYCAISGFDPDGHDRERPGFDLLAQAAGGLMAITGTEDGEPTKIGVALSDVLTAHHAHGAICAALVHREKSGEGSVLEVSLLGSTIASLINVGQAYLLTSREPKRLGNAHPAIVPYEAFRGADGASFVVAAASDRQYERLCRDVLGEPRLCDDERYVTNALRVTHRRELIEALQERFVTRSASEWIERCRAAGIPAAAVASMEEIFAPGPSDPTITIDHPTIGALRMARSPVVRDGVRPADASPPPRLGEHTDSVLAELGYSEPQIADLSTRGIL
ncbi:MAG TPA: CoA transferase [Thermoanaerobaculia bacterium]|nr:CoA transferase [Thermoanaerobaculia bacterium]